jgi:DNA modification methylase
MEHKKGGKSDPLAHTPQGAVGNNHPTVKPVALMRYLINLVVPKNSTILDPFTGSGSTGMAACELGHTFVGCELDPYYVDIANRRIEGWLQSEPTTTFDNLFESV